MVFSSLLFVFLFLSLNLVCYYTVKTIRQKNIVLLVFSLIFYAWGGAAYLLLLAGMAFWSWLCALMIEKNEEQKTRKLWIQRFENFVGRVDALCVPLRRKRDKWLDNCETCRLLNVSARTMQTYRDTGKLPYSQINNKIYYKASDVETFLLNQIRDNSKK